MTWTDREGAPFTQAVWDEIDAVARAAAGEVRAVRRVLPLVGPLGFSARAGVAEDLAIEEVVGRAHLHVPRVRALPVIHRSVSLGARGVEARLARDEPLALEAVAEAAREVARAEDHLALEGNAAAGVRGLAAAEGAIALPLGDWADPARAADDLLGALARLDAAGRHGPFAALVAPARFYALLRPHPSGLTPLAQLAPAFEGGIVRAPGLADVALVVSRGPSGPRLAIGAELTATYDGREGIFHRLSLVESVTLLPGAPGTVAVLKRG
jgi:uncharacterized linocin/CFP29 family protein